MPARRVAVYLVSIAATSAAQSLAAEPNLPGVPSASERAASESELAFSLLGGFGAGGRYQDNALNRYAAGVGARGGITLAAPRLYLGASFVHFNGGKDGSGEFYTNTLDAELGYDVRLLQGLFVLRPELALGVAQAVTIQSDNAGYPLVLHCAPGLLLGMRLLPLFASAEIRRDIVADEWSSATSFLFGAGIAF